MLKREKVGRGDGERGVGRMRRILTAMLCPKPDPGWGLAALM